MKFVFEERPSDSPFVEAIWRTQSEGAGTFTSLAATHSELVLSKCRGKLTFTVRGPETKATSAYCSVEGEFFGIILKLGTFMPHLPPGILLDRNDRDLPEATGNSFWLHGSVWQLPDYDNADTFVDRLVREGLLVHEPVVDAMLQGYVQDLSMRSIQRRFLHATGLTHGAVCQIERARYALTLLQQGVSILDTVELAGYADQPHLTRSLKHLVGQTPAQIIRQAMPTSRI
jgi:AraC-like DNA-binding protein